MAQTGQNNITKTQNWPKWAKKGLDWSKQAENGLQHTETGQDRSIRDPKQSKMGLNGTK